MKTRNCFEASVFLLAALALGPSCSAPSRGELVLVIQSDVSMPKDIDQFTITTRRLGSDEQPRTETYSVPGNKDPHLIPATLGLLPSGDPDATYEISLLATSQGQERILYKAGATIPSDRVGMLRMPIRFLCGVFYGGGSVYTRCPEGQTCNENGVCAPIGAAEDEIVDFAINKVYEDGTGQCDGTCFDTVACFDGLPPLPLDLAHYEATKTAEHEGECQLSAPPPPVNLGLMTRGQGACGKTGCFVPLLPISADSGERPLKIAPEVCKQTREGNILGVVGVQIGERCSKQYTVSTSMCGGWSSVGSCAEPAVDHEVVVAAGEDHPVDLAYSDKHLYWTTSGDYKDAPRGTVKSISLASGEVTLIQSGESTPRGIAATGSGADARAYWSNAGAEIQGIKNPGSIGRSNGDHLLADASGLPEGAAFGPDGAFFLTQFGSGQVWALGPSGVPMWQVEGLLNPYRIVAGAAHVYWTNEGNPNKADGSISRALLDGKEHVTLVAGQASPRSLALWTDGAPTTYLYFTSFTDKGRIARVDTSSPSAPVFVAINQSYPNGIAVDKDGAVYWTNWGDGTVMCLAKDATEPVVLVHDQKNPGAIVITPSITDTTTSGQSVVVPSTIAWINEGSAVSSDAPPRPDGSVKGDGSVMKRTWKPSCQ